MESWSLTTIRGMAVKIGAKVAARALCDVFQMTGLTVPRAKFRRTHGMIDDL